MMAPLLQTYDLVIGKPESPAIRFGVNRGEIVGLLSPANGSQRPFLRTLAGLEKPQAGRVRLHTAPSRIALIEPEDDLEQKLSEGPELVLVDGALDHLDPTKERAAWERLARESSCGVAVVLATTDAERAYRTDRLSLALWPESELVREFARLQQLMQARLHQFQELARARNGATNRGGRPAELLRLTRAARDIAREAAHITRSRDEAKRIRDAWTHLSRARTDAAVRALVAERLGRRPPPSTEE